MFKFATLAILHFYNLLRGFMYFLAQFSGSDLAQFSQFPQKRPLRTMSLPVTVATHPASLSPLALSSSIPHAASSQLPAARSGRPPGSFSRPGAVQSMNKGAC